jgi:hypothetical protein
MRRLIPEGLEDISLELDTYWLHLQAKSRREHRGEFTRNDLAPAWMHLAARLVADPTAHAALVLERPLRDGTTDLEKTLADVASPDFRAAIGATIGGEIALDDFLSRTHVLVVPAHEQTAIDLLAEKLRLPQATCGAHYGAIRRELGRLSDENGVRSSEDPASTTVGEIGRLIDDTSEAVDASALNEAVRDGLCELVDFATEVSDERFYEGVDAVVGHVVAGLPLERHELSDALTKALFERGTALAVGPSGCGKSALIWMTAYETRHLVRWYRVRRLRPRDVTALVRLAKGLQPSLEARVGFVCDDLGGQDRLGFDELLKELRGLPGTMLLGACREENCILVRTAHQIVQVRPQLDAALAELIWADLRKSGRTNCAGWREPFELSQGLLLEYGHLLTAGERLESTITEQVEQRLLESGRGLELEILAIVAAADAYGAELDATLLTSELRADTAPMKLALARLVDEHLISEHDGKLSGLHELRSLHIMRAIHRQPPPRLLDTMQRVIDLVDYATLQAFLVRVLVDEAVDDDAAINAVAARIAAEADPNVLAAALHAMRLVGLQRSTQHWREIFHATGARPIDAFLIAHFVSEDGDTGLFPKPLQRAVAEARKIPVDDLRRPLLARVAQHVCPALAGARDVGVAASVLAGCGEIGADIDIEAGALSELAQEASLADLRLLLEAAYTASPELATELVDAIGGPVPLLARLERELPWVRDARLGTSEDGQSVVEAKYAYVVESVQPPANDAVMEQVRYLAAFAPTASTIVCKAIDATGETAGFGMALADKAIPRRNLPPRASVCWNRARSRAAIAAVAASTTTQHQLAARSLIIRTGELVRLAGDAWVSGRGPGSHLKASVADLARAVGELRPAPLQIEAPGPLDEGELPIEDPVGHVATMVANNLVARLFDGQNVAPLIMDLSQEVEALRALGYWRLLDEPPHEELVALHRSLLDLHAVVYEQEVGDGRSLTAMQVAGREGLGAAATVARRRADVRVKAIARSVEHETERLGIHAVLRVRDTASEPGRQPQNDLLVLIEVAGIIEWSQRLATMIDQCKPMLGDRLGLLVAPVRDRRIVCSSAVRVLTSIYPDDTIRTWPELPFPLLDEQLGDSLRSGLQGLVEISGILATARQGGLHEAEEAALRSAGEREIATIERLRQLSESTQNPLVAELLDVFLALHGLIQEEAAALEEGTPVPNGLAASMIAGDRGTPNDIHNTAVGALACAVEWDVDPVGAWTRVQQTPGPTARTS